MEYTQIEYSVDGRVATVFLSRPHTNNAYTNDMATELAHAFDRADRDDAVRVVIFAGRGSHFCTGLDPSTAETLQGRTDAADAGEWAEPAGRCAMRIFEMHKPVIAAVSGAAIGAGATIILPADFRLAATDARFGFVFSRRGLFPEGASAWFLPRLVGMGTAMDWMVTGRLFGAEEALQSGLLHSVHEPEDLLGRAQQLAHAIVTKTSPVSVAVTRQLLYRMSALDSPTAAHRLDSRLMARCASSPDTAEGFQSLAENRPPDFPGKVSQDMPSILPWLKSAAP